jgi:hypothetical protein
VAELARQLRVHSLRNEVLARGWGGTKQPVVGAYGYYPEAWKRMADLMGYEASVNQDQPTRGWSVFKPKPEEAEFIKSVLNQAAFEVARDSEPVTVRKGSRMKKWRCNCTTVRCATKLEGHCDSCGAMFMWAEAREPAPDGYNTLTERAGVEDPALADWYTKLEAVQLTEKVIMGELRKQQQGGI